MNSFNRITHSRWRQGNALVLVTAMLVLLVLIATAYLSRTQSQRGTAAAMQDASGDTRRVEMIQKQIASEIAMHLFVKQVDPGSSLNYVGGDSSGNRITPSMYSVRYGVESATKLANVSSAVPPLGDVLNSGVDPSNPYPLTRGADGFPDGYNFAPYSVIPWTNWPDFISPRLVSSLPTTTPTTPMTNMFSVPNDPNGNPLGNPGFGDTRWLRSTEPVRMKKTKNENDVSNPAGDTFSHWPHLSWLPTPANGYRLVTDIADIETNTLTGPMPIGGSANLNDAFGTPYEQWLPNVIPAPIPGAGTDPLADNTSWSTAFINRRKIWFTNSSQSTTNSYQKAITSANAILTLPNFIKLDDPLGVGRTLDPTKPGVSKSEEWIDMTPRNVVSRTFCDTDGDGFTDSFWFLAPVGKERNVRTVVGVSVIDNASMVDVNVATRADRRTTVGFTPSDVALVTSEPERSRSDVITVGVFGAPTDTLVGLLDNPFNRVDSNDQGDETHEPIEAHDFDAMTAPYKFRVQFDPYRWAGYPVYYDPRLGTVGKHDVGQPSFLQALGLRSNTGTWNDYFYGSSVVTTPIVAPTNEPFSGDMRDLFGPSGPARPSQENPTYRKSLDSNTNFKSALPNQPLVRPSERTRWFRSAATGQGTLFAEVLDAGNISAGIEQAPTGDLFGIPVPTRRFDASDELELRANAGNNDASSMSRLERSLNADDNIRDGGFLIGDTILRSTVLRGEAGGGGEQLTSPQLVKDLRRKITVVSGQRNEIMPPWLWIGRPYGVESPDPRETYQNAMLWLGLHPESPGPRDEDGNGRIDSGNNGKSELGFGKMDLYRIAMSDDPFPDGNRSADIALDTPIDGRDFNRAVRYFEGINSKLDLRKPLLVSKDLKNTAGALTPDGVPDRTSDGLLDQYMAITVNDQRLAMNDFVREARGRLRAALRIHSPMTPLSTNAFGLISTEVLGINDTFASYTDRFYEQFLFTTNAQTVPTQLVPSQSTPLPNGNPNSFQIRIQDPNEDGKRVSVSTLGQLDTPATTANQAMAYRSAWSTEALTASMAANIATWRSRADLIYSPTIQNVAGVVQVGPDPTLPLRAIHQPILPDVNPISLDGNFLRPYLQSRFDPDDPTPDPSTHPRPDPKQKESPLIPPLATRAVDPSKKTTEFENNNFTPGTDPAGTAVLQPNGRTADIVFPGIEKHPFFTEVFFGWVYPATTAEGEIGSLEGQNKNKLTFAQYTFCECPEPQVKKTKPVYKYVALVNGKVGTPSASGIEGPRWYSGLTELGNSGDNVVSDTKRDQLNEIRTPVLVVQVANPWNEPIRLGDFRINMFGTDYDFPDYELDSDGTIIKDRDGKPIPLMLAAATETEPSTATVYLIANVLGNTDDATKTSTNNYNDSKYDEYSSTHNPPTGIQVCKSTEGDLTRVAMWDPLFRRRWLDYFDLFEFSDSPIATSTSWFSSSNPVEGYASKLPTSPKANPLFWYTNKDAPSGSSVMPRSKLLNAMHPIKGKKTVCDTNADGLIDDVKGNTVGTYDDPSDTDDATVIYDMPELTHEEDAPNASPSPSVPTGISALRHSTLQRFKNSLTKQNLSLGITLHRVLKNPAAVALGKRQNIKSEISTDYFLTDSTDPPQNATSAVYRKQTIKHWVDVTLEVDRFDAHSDFDHWTTTGKKTLTDLAPGVPEDPANNPPMFADNRNFDTNLVTGGRFWTAAARITLPPSFGTVTKLTTPQPEPPVDPPLTEIVGVDLTTVLGAGPNDSSGWPIAPNGTMTTAIAPEVSVSVFPTVSDYCFDGPGASQDYFPPPTAKPLVRSTTNPFRLQDITGLGGTPSPGNSGSAPCPCGNQGELADSVKLPPFPGIILGENNDTVTLKRSDADYFTTWTHVSRSWSRLFDAKFVTVPADNIAPIRQGYSPEELASVTQNLPVWNYTRQLVTDSTTSSFASNPIDSDAVLPANTIIESRSPTIPKERSAPRFIFSNRTEPESTNRPLKLQPARVVLTSLVMNRKKTTGQRGGALPKAFRAGSGALDSEKKYAHGDVFSLSDANYDYNLTSQEITWSDPDVWHPPYDNTVANPTWGSDPDYNWMRNQATDPAVTPYASKPFMMLLTPVWAPLPDFCGLGQDAIRANGQGNTIQAADWPTLVLRKPTSFNCQTVFCAQFPNEPIQKDGEIAYPISPTNPAKNLTKHVVAYYDNPLNKPVPYVQDPDALPLINVPTVPSTNTQFVLPKWAAPSGSGSATPPNGTIAEGPFRVYMADKSARLLDHDGLLLPIDLASGSEVVADAAAIPPVLARPWLARGLWNTLDRIPQAGSLQMLQKDDDFEQIGELLDVFAWGPAYRINLMTNALAMTNETSMVTNILSTDIPTVPPTLPSRQIPVPNGQAKATFSEIMSNRVPGFPVGEGPFINRIQVDPLNVAFTQHNNSLVKNGAYQFGGTSALRTPYAPNVPWGMRIFDCFTVDGAGAALRFDWTLPANSSEIAAGGSALPNAISATGNRPVGALVPVDVRGTINTATTTVVTPQILAQWEYDRSPSLSGNFAGLPTKGLLNINTAPLEVMRTLPHMTQMVYDDTGRFDGDSPAPTKIAEQIPWPGTFTETSTAKNRLGDNPAVLLPEAIEIYRNQLNPSNWVPDLLNPMAPLATPSNSGEDPPDYPTYIDRGKAISFSAPDTAPPQISLPLTRVGYNTGMQSQRGISSIGEIIGIARETNVDRIDPASNDIWKDGWKLPSAISARRLWSVRLAGLNPNMWYSSDTWKLSTKYRWGVRDGDSEDLDLDPLDARLSTDRQGVRQFDFVTGSAIKDRQVLTYDSSYGDSEELNLLFKGISNLVTTRSDVFTVYFKVRTVKQNPTDGKWNGTDRESVLDDARYVMCVDRSNVNRPSDEPRIVYFSRVPD